MDSGVDVFGSRMSGMVRWFDESGNGVFGACSGEGERVLRTVPSGDTSSRVSLVAFQSLLF